MKAPVAKKINKELTIHGDTRIDPYFWLNERENQEVIDYLNQENDYTKDQLKDTEALQKELFDEIVGRIKKDDRSVPYFLDGYFYYTRYEDGKEYPIYCRKKESLENEEEIILEVNELAKGHEFYQVGSLSISPNNNILAFSVDTLSRRIYTIHFKDLTTGEILEEKIENTESSITWAEDDQTVFYTVKDETLRPYKIFKHKFRSDTTDEEVYHEEDETFTCGISKTKSKQYLVISSASSISTEARLLDSKDPDGEFKIFQTREDDHEYGFEHYVDGFYIHTNWNAKNFRLMKCENFPSSKADWQELIPHKEDVLIEDFELFPNHLVLEVRKNGLTNIEIRNRKTGEIKDLDFGEETYAAFIDYNPNYDTCWLRYGYSSMTTPHSTIDYNLDTDEKIIRKEQQVLGGFDKSNYQTKRIWATARDGAKIPISYVHHKDTILNDKTPVLLYAYGSYGYSIDATFASTRISLLDRGFVFAIAHIRGGEEMGRHWYDDGKMLQKKNTFNDYVDCAKHFLNIGISSPEHMYGMGGSAGGLLMGAAINQAPELFNGVIAAVPFVDVVTTMLDESIPLTTGEYDEWGNPNEKEYYEYMLSYSPYDNVEEKDYPNLLVTTGLHDSQVQYWEPAKWVAKLRDLKTDHNQLLLHTNMSTGHSGASGRFETHKETAMEFAFLINLES